MIFKAIALVAIVAILLAGLVFARRRRRSIVAKGTWLAVWAIAGVLIWKPEITSRAAGLVGIGRGSDLVFYVAIIALTAAVLSVFVWVDSLDERITKLVQHDAIEEYERTSKPAAGRDHHPDS